MQNTGQSSRLAKSSAAAVAAGLYRVDGDAPVLGKPTRPLLDFLRCRPDKVTVKRTRGNFLCLLLQNGNSCTKPQLSRENSMQRTFSAARLLV